MRFLKLLIFKAYLQLIKIGAVLPILSLGDPQNKLDVQYVGASLKKKAGEHTNTREEMHPVEKSIFTFVLLKKCVICEKNIKRNCRLLMYFAKMDPS